MHLLVDGPRKELVGHREWLAYTSRVRIADDIIHKVHLAMDVVAGDVHTLKFTSSLEGESPMLPGKLERFPPDK